MVAELAAELVSTKLRVWVAVLNFLGTVCTRKVGLGETLIL